MIFENSKNNRFRPITDGIRTHARLSPRHLARCRPKVTLPGVLSDEVAEQFLKTANIGNDARETLFRDLGGSGSLASTLKVMAFGRFGREPGSNRVRPGALRLRSYPCSSSRSRPRTPFRCRTTSHARMAPMRSLNAFRTQARRRRRTRPPMRCRATFP